MLPNINVSKRSYLVNALGRSVCLSQGCPGWSAGRTWTPPTPTTSVKTNSPSYYRRCSERSKALRDSRKVTKLNLSESNDSESKVSDKSMEANEKPVVVDMPETVEFVVKPETAD